MGEIQKLKVVDSHTAGEPTRTVVSGFPKLEGRTLKDKLGSFKRDLDHLRAGIVREPRGHDAVVGALLTEPENVSSAAGVIFFNNVGYLGMCGHGTIGVVRTLEYLGKIGKGTHSIETPAGIVRAELFDNGEVAITNVPSYRYEKQVEVFVPEHGRVVGDIAYGGNWFFLVNEHPLSLDKPDLTELIRFSSAVRKALTDAGKTGRDGAEIDHIELFSPSANADSRNFVLCPGTEYDRSPCGTGTSAKLACLFEDGKLKEGEEWRQESIIGSVFVGSVKVMNGETIPTIRGSAFVTAESDLIFQDEDPFQFGFK